MRHYSAATTRARSSRSRLLLVTAMGLTSACAFIPSAAWAQGKNPSGRPATGPERPAAAAEAGNEVENRDVPVGSPEIIVTASKRGATFIQDAPYNISAVTGEQLQRSGAFDFADVSRLVPGLYSTGSPGNRRIVVRGLAASAGQPQVGVYIDEISTYGFGGANVRETELGLYDLNRIEVLRGPQGTLYGGGSQGGTVRYITNKPVFDRVEASALGVAGLRSRDAGLRYSVNGMLNLPVASDVFAVRAVGYYEHQGGFVDLPAIGRENVGDQKRYGGRVLGQLNIGPNTKLYASAHYQMLDREDSGAVRLEGDFRREPVVEPNTDKLNMYNVTLEQNLGFGSLTASGSIYDRHTYFVLDSSQFTPGRLVALNQPRETLVHTGEVRFASDFHSPLQLVVGGFYQKRWVHDESFLLNVDPSTGLSSDKTTRPFYQTAEAHVTNKALFGEISYDLTKRLTVLAGLRVFEISRFSQSNLRADIFGRTPGVQPVLASNLSDYVKKFQVTYRFSDDILSYVLYSEGFREGGENAINLIGTVPATFDPDTVKNYEVGWKSVLADRQIVLNIAAYYMKWANIQVTQRDATGAFTFTSNAGKAELYGIEIEGSINPRPMRGFSINYGFRVSQARLTEDNPLVNFPRPGANPNAGRKGDRIPFSSPVAYNLGVEQRFPVGSMQGYVRGDMLFDGRVRTAFNPRDPNNRNMGNYALVNARAGVESRKWEAALYVRNLFDVREPIQYPGGAPAERIYTTDPREAGVQVSFRF